MLSSICTCQFQFAGTIIRTAYTGTVSGVDVAWIKVDVDGDILLSAGPRVSGAAFVVSTFSWEGKGHSIAGSTYDWTSGSTDDSTADSTAVSTDDSTTGSTDFFTFFFVGSAKDKASRLYYIKTPKSRLQYMSIVIYISVR